MNTVELKEYYDRLILSYQELILTELQDFKIIQVKKYEIIIELYSNKISLSIRTTSPILKANLIFYDKVITNYSKEIKYLKDLRKEISELINKFKNYYQNMLTLSFPDDIIEIIADYNLSSLLIKD